MSGAGKGVAVGVAVDVGVGVTVGVGVGVGVAVAVGVAVDVSLGVAVAVGVGVTVAVAVGVAVGVTLLGGTGVGIGVAVAVGVASGVLVGFASPSMSATAWTVACTPASMVADIGASDGSEEPHDRPATITTKPMSVTRRIAAARKTRTATNAPCAECLAVSMMRIIGRSQP